MKKLSVFVLVCILMLSLTACHPEQDVIQAIDAIGPVKEITLESTDAIDQAQALYDALTDEEKEKVTNANILQEAKEEVARQNDLIEEAAASIEAIGDVTIMSGDLILKAREDYDAAIAYDIYGVLKDSEKVLIRAEEEIAQLNEYIAGFDQDLDTLNQLMDQGNFLQMVDESLKMLEKIPAGKLADMEEELKTVLINLMVDANCVYANELFEDGNRYDAVLRLAMFTEYEDYITAETFEHINELLDKFIAALEDSRPKNGEIIARTNKPGRNTFEFTAGDLDTCLKLILADDPSQYMLVYVRANETTKFNLLNGNYIVRYTAGNYWFGDDIMFGPDATYVEYSEEIELAGYTNPATNTIHWHSLTWAPSVGYGDDFGYQNMSPEDF